MIAEEEDHRSQDGKNNKGNGEKDPKTMEDPHLVGQGEILPPKEGGVPKGRKGKEENGEEERPPDLQPPPGKKSIGDRQGKKKDEECPKGSPRSQSQKSGQNRSPNKTFGGAVADKPQKVDSP